MAADGAIHQAEVGGHVTDLVRFAGRCGEDEGPVLVFVTGNPGAIDFFVPFLRRVWEMSGGSIECWGIAHAGHSVSTATEQILGLQAQVDHKVAFLRERFSGSRPVILVGHSMGAWVALRTVEALLATEVNIVRFIGLCPVVSQIAQARNARLSAPLIHMAFLRSLVASAAGGLAALPRGVLKPLLSLGLRVEPYADASCRDDNVNALLKILDARVARNVFGLTLEETRDFQSPELLAAPVERLGAAAVWIYSPVDGWVAPGAADALRERFPKGTFEFLEEPWLCHMFSLNVRAQRAMAACTWSHVREALKEANGQSRL